MFSSSRKKYKFQHLKFYVNNQGLYGTKKFRKVFDQQEIGFVYCEFALFNILFDEEDWEAQIRLEGFAVENGRERHMFKIDEKRQVPKQDNIYHYRDGWGKADKTYWKKGHYRWKIFVDDELVGQEEFFIEHEGLVTASVNPYFDILGIRFYTLDDNKRAIYFNEFKADGTKHIYTELSFKNKVNKPWHCEVEFKYFNENMQKVAYFTDYSIIQGNTGIATYGYGSSSGKWWVEGTYTCKIMFMGQLIAVSSFKVGKENKVGESKILDKNFLSPQLSGSATETQQEENIPEKTLDELLEDFNKLIGLNKVKQQLNEYITFLNFEKIREEKGLKAETKINLHSVFTGNPGTGKTTVAKKMGAIFHAIGLLSKGHVHEVDRADLVGGFIGQTAPKTKEHIEKARGGILFIDEAYSLHRPGTENDFGREAIEILLKEMSDGPGDLAVFVAGYPTEMTGFIESNPGLKSRFNKYFEFQDYLPEELLEIAEAAIKPSEFEITQEAKDFLLERVTREYRERDKNFGNARYVLALIDEAKMNLAMRLAGVKDPSSLTKEALSTIQLEDIQSLFFSGKDKKLKLSIDEPMLHDALNELESLIGMENIKQEIRNLVKLVRYYNEIGKDVLNSFVLHTVFKGNPGTGKTTVARIFARIFNALGIIEKGHLVECDRSDLVAKYVGQTAPKTLAKIEEAMGGVLFIDEAYSLTEGSGDAFGREAISTLLKQMEDRNKEFILIVAGYPHNMDEFLLSNPGLKSRFERTMIFEDYSSDELINIAELMFRKEDLRLLPEARKQLMEYFDDLHETRDAHFGNAREVRKTVQEIIRFHHLRMADLPADERTVDEITTIDLKDLESLPSVDAAKKQSGIGFRINR
ncbi:MAG: AAA family ATPase [Brumimicrobium sp.]|nr:AAA family ATPase [Brumimicrobium sp.]